MFRSSGAVLCGARSLEYISKDIDVGKFCGENASRDREGFASANYFDVYVRTSGLTAVNISLSYREGNFGVNFILFDGIED